MLRKIQLKDCTVILENFEINQGKIIITEFQANYSYYWGAMGGTIEEFILSINSDYFAGKLCHEDRSFDAKATFKNVRQFIRDETYELNYWWKHMEFQKDMREKLNEFQENCETEESFVYGWDGFIRDLDYYLIEDKFDRDYVKNELEGISEIWHFIEQCPSRSYKRLMNIHKELKKALKKGEGEIFVKKDEKTLV